MIEERYNVGFNADYSMFEFMSEGPKGKIKKIIHYTQTSNPDVYNLGFGDKNELTNEIDDFIITNNGDSQKVLATVAATLFVFTDHYPNAFILATGSTLARTRLYRIGISNNLLLIEKDFYIFGYNGKNWLPFQKNTHYESFLAKRKK